LVRIAGEDLLLGERSALTEQGLPAATLPADRLDDLYRFGRSERKTLSVASRTAGTFGT